MNILILSWRGPGHPHAGGAEKSTHEHAKGWVKMDHRVTIFTSYFPDAKREEVIDGINIKRYGRQMFGVQWEAFLWYLFKPHEKFDLVIDQFHGIPFFIPFYVRGKKLAFIHEVAKEVWSLNPWPKPYNFFPSTFGRLFEPLIFLFYKYVPFMTVSKSTKDDLIRWGIPDKNITIIHNGTNIPRGLKRFEKEKEPTLIFLGALSRDKGIEDALEVFSILSTKTKWKFWVVGKGDENYLKRLKLLCKELNIEQRVAFYGFVEENRKFELLSKAHLLINTSVREGWGLVVIEAASVATPTLAFNVPGLRDSIKDGITGLLCKNRNNVELADLIKKTLSNEENLDKLSKNAYKWSKKFSWEKSVKKSLTLIEKITRS
ncbi:MAG: Glycosyl transferase family protein [Microgenomates group bacterium Gr01-1014_7]|nr:MAG: Glycosyl transferase family protein [Microgenomates group bacterium Gr01-1014_7]